VELTLSHFSTMYCGDCVTLNVSHTAIIDFAKGDEIKVHSSNLEPLRLTERNRAGGMCLCQCVCVCVCVYLSNLPSLSILVH